MSKQPYLRATGATVHAPGPWTLGKATGSRAVDGMDIFANQAEVGDRLPAQAFASTNARQVANARLISSAPDYAAGVELMLINEVCGGDDWWRGFEMLKEAHRKAGFQIPYEESPAQ